MLIITIIILLILATISISAISDNDGILSYVFAKKNETLNLLQNEQKYLNESFYGDENITVIDPQDPEISVH